MKENTFYTAILDVRDTYGHYVCRFVYTWIWVYVHHAPSYVYSWLGQ